VKGDISDEAKQEYEKELKAFDKLISNVQTFDFLSFFQFEMNKIK